MIRAMSKCARRPSGEPIEFNGLIEQLREAGLSLPLLVRFPGILQDRVRRLTGAFDVNIERMEYAGKYTALYPIKVNQQEAVVENIIATQRFHRPGGRLQAGADGRAGAGAEARHHCLQWLPGSRVHSAGADGAEARPQCIHRHREGVRGRPGDRGGQRAQADPAGRPARAPVVAGIVRGPIPVASVPVRLVRSAVALGDRTLPRRRDGSGHSPAALPHGLTNRQPGGLPSGLP